MNLKESFRYQTFLDRLMNEAMTTLVDRRHCFKAEKYHHVSDADPGSADKQEVVDVGEFPDNDKVIRFAEALIEEKEKLTTAITKAKASIGFDIEAGIASNKLRQQLHQSIKFILSFKPKTETELGCGYRLNVEGNQVQFRYLIDVTEEDLFDRDGARDTMRKEIQKADRVSNDIEAAMINTIVEYDKPWDVNEPFDEIIAGFGTA